MATDPAAGTASLAPALSTSRKEIERPGKHMAAIDTETPNSLKTLVALDTETPNSIALSISTRSGTECAPSPSVASSVSGSSRVPRVYATESLKWNDMHLGLKLQPYERYARCAEDLKLLSTFFSLSQLELDGDGIKALLKTLKLLRECDYCSEDICSVLAHVSAYYQEVREACGSSMEQQEVAFVVVVLMFIGHSHVLDECCPLRFWHRHIFQKYCDLQLLNAAVLRLMQLMGYRLRVAEADLQPRYLRLCKELQKP